MPGTEGDVRIDCVGGPSAFHLGNLGLEVFVPWAAAALVLFAVAAAVGGAAWAARAAVSVSGVCLLLALLRFRRAR